MKSSGTKKPKIGMYVKCLLKEFANNTDIYKNTGIIRSTDNNSVGIEFHKPLKRGHRLDATIEKHQGWYIDIEHWNDEEFEILKINWKDYFN